MVMKLDAFDDISRRMLLGVVCLVTSRCFTSESPKISSSPTRPRNMSTVRISAIEASTASLVHLERTLVRFRTVLVCKLVISCFPLASTARFALYLLMSKKSMVTCVYELYLLAFTMSISLCRLSFTMPRCNYFSIQDSVRIH